MTSNASGQSARGRAEERSCLLAAHRRSIQNLNQLIRRPPVRSTHKARQIPAWGIPRHILACRSKCGQRLVLVCETRKILLPGIVARLTKGIRKDLGPRTILLLNIRCGLNNLSLAFLIRVNNVKSAFLLVLFAGRTDFGKIVIPAVILDAAQL